MYVCMYVCIQSLIEFTDNCVQDQREEQLGP